MHESGTSLNFTPTPCQAFTGSGHSGTWPSSPPVCASSEKPERDQDQDKGDSACTVLEGLLPFRVPKPVAPAPAFREASRGEMVAWM